MNILPNTEKLSGLGQSGGWQQVARRRYQKGNTRKRGKRNPVWELQYWADFITSEGKIGRKRESVILGSVSDMNRREALKAADEYLRPVNSGKKLPHSTLKFEEFAEKYFVPNVFPILKEATRRRYRITLTKHLLPAFGQKRLCDIGTLDIQQFVLKKMDGGLSWEYADHFRNLMSKVYASAKKWGYFGGDNPAAGVELPEKKPVREKHILEPVKIPRLFAELREPVRTMVSLGIFTGMRVGEILGLRWQDVDFQAEQLQISQSLYRGSFGSPKTKASKRMLPLPGAVLEELALHYRRSQKRDGPDLVFLSRKGTPFSDTNLLHRDLKPAGAAIGAPWLSWHTLRRTHATLLQLAGGSAKDAQAQLGHTKMSTTMDIYTVPLPAHQRQAVEQLSQLVTNGDEFGQKPGKLASLSTKIQ